MRDSIKATVLLAVFSALGWAQPGGLPAGALRVVDSALFLLGMDRRDWWLPGEIGEADKHRLPVTSALFREPFQSLALVAREAELLTALRPATVDRAAHHWFELLALGEYAPQYYEQRLSARELDNLLGVELEQRLGLIAATSLRQYLAPVIQAWRDIVAARAALRHFALLTDLGDSLLMLSEEDSKASLFELKAREIWGIEQARRFFHAAAETPWQRLIAPMFSLWRAVWATVERNSPPLDRYRDSVGTTILETPFGRIAVGGPGDDAYVGDFTLIVDVGGNDRYLFPSFAKAEALARPARVIVDLSGDDLYDGGDFTFGSGFFGCGILVDLQGNDVYRSRHFAQGAAIGGIGILWDGAGTDRYIGGVHVQGAAAFGLGLLADGDGNDLYQCFAQSQGFGFVRGYGALLERSGNDTYVAQSPYVDVLRYEQHYLTFAQGAALGYRPIASGGVGILLDSAGNDTYVSDIYGQGTGYWYALGALVDGGGEDRYVSYQYAQGAGIHLAFGLLWDISGNDAYIAHGVSQGCGHDIALGMLYDAAGDDYYLCESLSQGAANANGLALLLDLHGSDGYSARRPNTMGYGDFRRHYGSLGIFADAEGVDWYADTAANRRARVRSSYGTLLDAELLPSLPPPPRPGIDVPDSLRMPLAGSLDSLFIQASASAQRFQYIVQPARERLVSLGASALPFLATKFATESPRERLALEEILPGIASRDSAALYRLVVDSLRSAQERTVLLMGTIAGKLRLRAAVPALQALLSDERWHIRAMAALRLGEIADPGTQPALRRCLEDPHPMVRARAAYALLHIQPYQSEEVWKRILQDTFQVVRFSALHGAIQHGKLSLSLLEKLWGLPIPLAYRKALGWLLMGVDTGAVSPARIARLLLQQPLRVRQTAYFALAQQRTNPWV
ncbi:MAG: HEAT repeat domain-containing protein, partial [Candidatus Kapabacteria bacterium]|nr:HEAT repeat domain-containing protein [Candidatus Kapabacteria bacterium]